MTAAELRQLRQRATDAGLSLARYLVASGLGGAPPPLSAEDRAQRQRALFHARKIGVNLNQIAHRLNAEEDVAAGELAAALPAEITVAGSGGVGVIDPAEDRERVFATLDRIAAETPPIRASFGPVIRFPNTDIFVLSLADPAPVRALHERIARSGLRFRPVPFDFTPHCTLRSRSPVTEEEAADLLAVAIAGGFVLDAISVYMLDQPPMTLLHRAKLMGKRGA